MKFVNGLCGNRITKKCHDLGLESIGKDIEESEDEINRTLVFAKKQLKEFKKGFQEAIRNAHASMNDIAYDPFLIETIGKDKKEIVTVNPVLVEEVKEVKLEVELPVINNIEAAQISPINNIALSTTLYAQPVEKGFQLINLKPQVVFVILNTSVKGVFLIKDKNGLLYKKGENWIAEFYDNGKLIEKKYQVKF